MKLLALETSTERMSLAVQHGDHCLRHEAEGGAQSSATLIPAIMALLAQAQLPLQDLNAICLGQGPGAFTGLRTACAVAQGLALGADLKVLPIDTLLCVAEAVRTHSPRVLVVMDARMNQVYSGAYEWQQDRWHTVQAPQLSSASDLALPTAWADQSFALAGNASAQETLLADMQHLLTPHTPVLPQWPSASALLRLGAAAWARGEAVAPEWALPVYVRDQVALTTAERMQLKAATP